MTKPEVCLQHAALAANTDRAWDALMESRPADEVIPKVMVRGSELVRWTERGELEPYTVTTLRKRLSELTEFTKPGKVENEPIDPPKEIVDTLLQSDSSEYVGGPRVDRIVDTPVLGSDLKIIDEPGYHEADRLLYVPADALRDVRGRSDYKENVEDALAVMDDLLGDFGFEDQASKANALALLLTPFVREYIGDSPTPLFLIVAPEVGTGKTLLAQAALVPACGMVPLTAETKNEEEQRKRITATLLAGARAIVIDNIAGSVNSSVLAGAITTGIWADRMLGETKQLVLPIRNVWVGTGNNLDLTDDNMRRSVPILLDPGEIRPSDRPKGEYQHPDLLAWALASRAKLVEAALTLVKNWTEGVPVEQHSLHGFVRMDPEGREPGDEGYHPVLHPTDRTLGSFERWGEVVGGILAAAGVTGFLANRDRLKSLNPERDEVTFFLEAWHALGLEPITSKDLMEHCLPEGDLREALPEALEGFGLDSLKLGKWLGAKKDAKFGARKVIGTPGGAGKTHWSVS
jgi:hypothetical protein